jgi:hypothetical protein
MRVEDCHKKLSAPLPDSEDHLAQDLNL